MAGCYACRRTGVILQGKTALGTFWGVGMAACHKRAFTRSLLEDFYRENDVLCHQKRNLLNIGLIWTMIWNAKMWDIVKTNIFQKNFLSEYVQKLPE